MQAKPQSPNAKIGEILISKGLITEDQLRQAMQTHLRKGGPFGDVLVSMGFVQAVEMGRIAADAAGLEHIDFHEVHIDGKNKALLPEPVAKRYHIVPVSDGDTLLVAAENALPMQIVKTIERLVKKPITVGISSKQDIADAFERIYKSETTLDFTDSNTSGIVDKLLLTALNTGASDIHIEALETMVKVRYRIDGILQEMATFPPDMLPVITSRIKVLAGLNIAERRSPQDGAFMYEAPNTTIDLRVSSLPCIHGEKIVMRLLAGKGKRLLMSEIGLSGRDDDCFNELIRRPHGIILIVGPTGSGKSTTLCAALNSINSPHVNITTVEDPVEYKIDGVNQVQIHSGDKISFAGALRSILRQDPDIVMVGETRDAETASISLRASLTGHLVFTTLHTNDAPGALPRLIDMGCEPFLVGASVSGVLAQRLIRRLCAKCKQAYEPTEAECLELGLDMVEVKGPWYKAKGCPFCANTGYKGRIGIFELLMVDENVRTEILKGSNSHVIGLAAQAGGMTTLRTDGIRKIQLGTTSVEEVLRTTLKV